MVNRVCLITQRAKSSEVCSSSHSNENHTHTHTHNHRVVQIEAVLITVGVAHSLSDRDN